MQNNTVGKIFFVCFPKFTACTCYSSLVPMAYYFVSPGGHTEETIVRDDWYVIISCSYKEEEGPFSCTHPVMW